MANPFLDIDDFADEFGRTLSAAETLVATRLLQVVSDWIRGKKPDADETAAAEVVFEVVRDQINYGAFERLSAFTNTTADRTEAGTFNMSRQLVKGVADLLTDEQKRLLGMPLRAAPVGSFPAAPTDACFPSRAWCWD